MTLTIAKRKFVYQSKLDGKIYGKMQSWTPQQAGKVNAQNRMDGAYGLWVDAAYLSDKELNNRGSEEDAANCRAVAALREKKC
jgi:hypothetical protein